MALVPDKLKQGDEIRVIAPSSSAKTISSENMLLAKNRLEILGYSVSFGRHIYERDMMNSSSIQSRMDDLHEAFQDNSVKAILAVCGGSSSNQLLKYIDYDLVLNNPKVFCGFSDITALQNAIYAKTRLITYSGPNFSSFAMQKGNQYTIDCFQRLLTQNSPVIVDPSPKWSDDAWFLDQNDRTFHHNEGPWIIQSGKAEGTLVGGNISTFQLLNGTEYRPCLKGTILFIEADAIAGSNEAAEFDRDFQSLLQQDGADQIQGIVIGRFEQKVSMTREKLSYIIQTKKEIRNIPIVANVDFGHTMPIFTYPIGGKCRMSAEADKVTISLEG